MLKETFVTPEALEVPEPKMPGGRAESAGRSFSPGMAHGTLSSQPGLTLQEL